MHSPRRWAPRVSRVRFVAGIVFALVCLLAITILKGYVDRNPLGMDVLAPLLSGICMLAAINVLAMYQLFAIHDEHPSSRSDYEITTSVLSFVGPFILGICVGGVQFVVRLMVNGNNPIEPIWIISALLNVILALTYHVPGTAGMASWSLQRRPQQHILRTLGFWIVGTMFASAVLAIFGSMGNRHIPDFPGMREKLVGEMSYLEVWALSLLVNVPCVVTALFRTRP